MEVEYKVGRDTVKRDRIVWVNLYRLELAMNSTVTEVIGDVGLIGQGAMSRAVGGLELERECVWDRIV